jgi:hypothetical protein
MISSTFGGADPELSPGWDGEQQRRSRAHPRDKEKGKDLNIVHNETVYRQRAKRGDYQVY